MPFFLGGGLVQECRVDMERLVIEWGWDICCKIPKELKHEN